MTSILDSKAIFGQPEICIENVSGSLTFKDSNNASVTLSSLQLARRVETINLGISKHNSFFRTPYPELCFKSGTINTSTTVSSYAFDATIEEFLIYDIYLPPDLDPDGTVNIRFEWLSEIESSDSVVWKIYHASIETGSTFDVDLTLSNHYNIVVSDALGTASNDKISTAVITATVDSLAWIGGSHLVLHVSRCATHSSDDLAGDAHLIGLAVELPLLNSGGQDSGGGGPGGAGFTGDLEETQGYLNNSTTSTPVIVKDDDGLSIQNGAGTNSVNIQATDTSELTVDGTLNHNNNQDKNFRLENASSDPTAGNAGRLIYRTDIKQTRIDDGTSWSAVGGGFTGDLKEIQGYLNNSTASTAVIVKDNDGLSIQNGAGTNSVNIQATGVSELTVAGTLNHNNNQDKNFRIENASSDPTAGNIGRLIYRTDIKQTRIDDGTSWSAVADNTIGTNIGVYGFVDNSETTIGFNDSTYTFSLTRTGSLFRYYRAGILYTISSDKTVVLPGTPPSANTYYISIDSTDGTLSQSTSAWNLTTDTKVPVAIVQWNNSNTPKYMIANERHLCTMLRSEHIYLHSTTGARLEAGGLTSGYTVTPITPADTDNTFGVASTVIWDEDIRHSLSALTDPGGTGTDYLIQYLDSGSWTWVKSGVPFKYTNSGYIQYNNAGTMTEGASGFFYNWYLLATNLAGNERFVMIPGKMAYASFAIAQTERISDLELTGFPIAEAVVLYQFIYETNVNYSTKGKCRLASEPFQILSSISASISIPGYGTISMQDSNSVSITGGSIAETSLALKCITTDPLGPVAGSCYYNTTNKSLKTYNGSDWEHSVNTSGLTTGRILLASDLNTSTDDSGLIYDSITKQIVLSGSSSVETRLNAGNQYSRITRTLANDLICKNIVTTVSSSGKAYSFNGTNYVYAVIDLRATDNVSIECWAYMPDINSFTKGIFSTNSTVSDNLIFMGIARSGYTALDFYCDGAWRTGASNCVVNAAWNHVVQTLSVSGGVGTWKLYANGVQVGSTYTGGLTNRSNSNRIYFGTSCNALGAGTWWNGYMDEMRVYSKILSNIEITNHYNNGLGTYGVQELNLLAGWHCDNAATDYSGNGKTFSTSGSPTFATSTVAGAGVAEVTIWGSQLSLVDGETGIQSFGDTGGSTVIQGKNVKVSNLIFEGRTSDPSTPVAGQNYYDTTNKSLKIYNGTAWEQCGNVSATGLTSGRVPYATDLNSLIDDTGFTYSSGILSVNTVQAVTTNGDLTLQPNGTGSNVTIASSKTLLTKTDGKAFSIQSAAGVDVAAHYPIRVITTNSATATEMTTDGAAVGSSNILPSLASGDVCLYEVHVVCKCTAGTNINLTGGWRYSFVIKNIGGTVTVVNYEKSTITNEVSGTWDINVVVNSTHPAVQVTGGAASTIAWRGIAKLTKYA